MKTKTHVRNALLILVVGSVLYVAGQEYLGRRVAAESPEGTAKQETAVTKLVVYYFSQGKECVTCEQIEAYTRNALDTHFAEELASGLIVWRSVDVDQPRNEHFITEYGIYTKSVVLVKMDAGTQVGWKNLRDVWELLSDQAAFDEYIRAQVRDYLDGGS